MRYLKERAGVIARELLRLSVVQSFEVNEWKYKRGFYVNPKDADATPWESFNGRTGHWYGPDKFYWFRSAFKTPESFEGKPLWIKVKTQIESDDGGQNAQFLLFIDGEAAQGLDMNHQEVLLTRSAEAGREYTLDLQAYTGTLHSEFKLICEVNETDAEVSGLYYDMQVPLLAFNRLKEEKLKITLQEILNDTVNLIDLRKPHSEEFFASVAKARQYIGKALYTDMAGFDEVIATCIGHTHIDVAWLWTVEQVRQKTARSFSTVLKLMDEFPNYRFMSSQPVLYEFVQKRYPALFDRIKEKVLEGRWETEGGMWLEADCNLTSGESLIRQFLYGKKFFHENFGKDNRVLWLPDVFGYSGALPQIMKKCGIDYFMTTKLSWNQYNKIPHDTFIWRGIDGTEVLTHLITTPDPGQAPENYFTTYNGKLQPDTVIGAWDRYQDKAINNDVLISYGYGDGGGGPTRGMLETSARMEKGIKGLPRVRQEFSRKYFEELEARVRGHKRLALWEGELYFEYHRGTLTSMGQNKRANRKCELALMDCELLSVLAEKKGLPYPQEKLDGLWKGVLLNQFHDILPGTAIREAYEQTAIEYEEITKRINELTTASLNTLTGSGENIAVFNTLGFTRDDVVIFDKLDASALMDDSRNVYPVQQIEGGAVAYLRGLPSKSAKLFTKATINALEETFIIDGDTFESKFYRITFADDKTIISIFDKEAGREVLQKGTRANRLRVFEDKPMNFDNWDIDEYYTEKSWEVNDLTSARWISGHVRATLEIERRFSNSVIKQQIHFYADTKRVDFETHIDWHERQHLLKVFFPCEVHTDEAVFDIQFGNVTRKTNKNTSWDEARFESCGQKWIDVSENGYGVSLLNDCKYGHSVLNGEMALTLIKSGINPNPEADQGKHIFTYSLFPHMGGWREAGTVDEAYKLNQPALVKMNAGEVSQSPFISVDKPNVILETIKKADNGNGIIIRLYECFNARGRVKVSFGGKIQSASECDMLENGISSMNVSESGFSFDILPYEVKTFRVL